MLCFYESLHLWVLGSILPPLATFPTDFQFLSKPYFSILSEYGKLWLIWPETKITDKLKLGISFISFPGHSSQLIQNQMIHHAVPSAWLQGHVSVWKDRQHFSKGVPRNLGALWDPFRGSTSTPWMPSAPWSVCSSVLGLLKIQHMHCWSF